MLLAAACRDSETLTEARPGARAAITALQSQSSQTLDELLAAHADAVPEFGGLWLDSAGRLHVNLTNIAASQRAMNQVAPTLAAVRERVGPAVAMAPLFQIVRYNYRQLLNWREQLLANSAAFPGFTSLDIDEQVGAIVVGAIDSVAAQHSVDAFLQAERIPRGAVQVIREERPSLTANSNHLHLNLAFNPMPGGIVVGASGQGLCVYSVNVKYNGAAAFITNSHCSGTPGVVDTFQFHQGGEIVGAEVADPFGTFCSGVTRCRYSDATVVQLNGAKVGELGAIARTRFFDPYPPDGGVGDTIIDDAQPRFLMFFPGYSSNPVLGEQTQKMGRRTGWIQGPINKTCFDMNPGDGWIRRCTYRFNGEVIVGDSGSPIFFRIVCPGDTWPVVNCASYDGIQFARTQGQVYFSPVSGIFRDFPGLFEFTPP